MLNRNLLFGQPQTRQQISHADSAIKGLRLAIYDNFNAVGHAAQSVQNRALKRKP
jgi:hypothetical protein